MHADCIAEVVHAIGRELRKGEAESIEARLVSNMRELARTDPKWKEMSASERAIAAGELARAQDIESANNTLRRQASNLIAQVREVNALRERAAEMTGKNVTHKALFERFRQIENHINGIKHEIMGNLMDAIHASEPRFLGLLENREAVRDFAREVMGEQTGNEIAVKGAKAYLEQMEALRQRSNAAGTDIGKLDYGYLPQPHDVGKVSRAGQDQWVKDMISKVSRDRYLKEDGAVMNDGELQKFLNEAWVTISNEGRNKLEPGKSGAQGSRAARFDDMHRSLHFKDADAYLEYMDAYGRGSMLETIQGHTQQMAKNIGLMEEFGASPNSTYRLLKDHAEKADNVAGARENLANLDQVWDTLSGVTSQPVDANLAAKWQAARNLTSAVSLQNVLLSSITDVPLHLLTAWHNGMPLGETMINTFKAFGGDTVEAATRIGLATEHIAGEMKQWHSDNLAQNWTSKLANTTMKLSLIEAWTHGLRRGFGLTLSSTLEKMRHTDWADLHAKDLQRLKVAGIKEADWKVWQQAAPELVNGVEMLTKNGIRAIEGLDDATKDHAVAKLLGYIDQEAQIAVLSPDVMTRAAITQGTKSGTMGGEILRSMMLFKSFPLAIWFKHRRRIESIESTEGKIAYQVAMSTGLAAFGALALQLTDLKNGKDPRDMSTAKFWAAAAAKGGGLGVLGDALYTGMGGANPNGQSTSGELAKMAVGPLFGKAFDALDVTLGNLGKAKAGKTTHFGAELIRFAKQNTPFINLPYVQAALDHMVLHDLQEWVSPGYLGRMRAKLAQDWKQDYWWTPGQTLPDRLPNPAAAVGAH